MARPDVPYDYSRQLFALCPCHTKYIFTLSMPIALSSLHSATQRAWSGRDSQITRSRYSPGRDKNLKTVLNTRNAVGSSTSTTVNQEIKTQSNRESKVHLSLYNRAHTTDQVPSHVLPRTIKPPSNKVTFQPNSVNLFLSAGLRTPTPLAECFPRPVTIFKGLTAD